MNIEVFARIPAEDKITIQFANLTLEEVLKKFKTNYALVIDSKDKDGNIKRIVVVPEGQQADLYLFGSSRSSAAKNYRDFVEKVDIANVENPAKDITGGFITFYNTPSACGGVNPRKRGLGGNYVSPQVRIRF